MLLQVLSAGSNCYRSLPQMSGAEWRLNLYKNGSKMFEILFDRISPAELSEYRGEFGLYHLAKLSCEFIIERVSYEHFSATFVMPEVFLTRKSF